ncbi:MAG: polyribonucleotide nucleotidyltransferase [Chloroflexi bacterium]|nr:polyribonucleotide nucleotidyltransferase [Chloroflexota bacterium]
MLHHVETEIAGRILCLETGKLAGQANGAVTVQYGDTVVLVTATASTKPREGIDFLPLTVDYEERLYAAGKIPGGFIRREGRPTQAATLASRLTDRPIRPLFPKGLRNEVQIIITVLSADQENDPDILAVIGASAALGISDIPFDGPLGTSRIGLLNGQLVINPTFTQLQNSSLDLVLVSTRHKIMMVESDAKELTEQIIVDGIKLGTEVNQKIIDIQEQLRQMCGKEKMPLETPQPNPQVEAAVSTFLSEKGLVGLTEMVRSERDRNLSRVENELIETFKDKFPPTEVVAAFNSLLKAEVRDNVLKRNRRPGGRGLTEIRPISCEAGVLPRTHGSGLFTRGQTQVLTITTLGSKREEQLLDGLTPEERKRFMHHYNFPPFSVGEVRRVGSPGRREIGHGALVERAIMHVLPDEESFPYTMRLVSEVLSSNGSSSMASVCGSSLSLMDAGVPIKAAVAGVAMGLITGENGSYAILTDIEGMEDAHGDMDFKVAGTSQGVTALQLDTKLKGLDVEVLQRALEQARPARLQILARMEQAIATSRPELSRYAPRMYRISIDPEKIGTVIGPGGKMIRSIIDETKTTVDVEDDGTVIIGATNEEAAQKAIRRIEALTREAKVGDIFTGKVSRILNFGALVEILPGKEGLVHISELADYRVNRVEDVVKIGDEIMVVVTEIDRLGRVNLSRRRVFEAESGQAQEAGKEQTSAPASPRHGPPPSKDSQQPGSRDLRMTGTPPQRPPDQRPPRRMQ